MVSKADANRYIITEAAIDHLINRALPSLKSDEKKMAKGIAEEMKKVLSKKTAGHALSEPELKEDVIKRLNQIDVNGINNLLKALQQITRTLERAEGKTSKAYINTIEGNLTKSMLSLPNELLKEIKEQNQEIKKLNKHINTLNKKNESHQTIYAKLKNIAKEKDYELKQERELSKMAIAESEDRKKLLAKEKRAREYDGEIYAKSVEKLVSVNDEQVKKIDDLTTKLKQNGDRIQSLNRTITDYKGKFEAGKKLVQANNRTITKQGKQIDDIAGDFGKLALNNFLKNKGLKVKNGSTEEYAQAVGIIAAARKGGSVGNKKIEQLVGTILPSFTVADENGKTLRGIGGVQSNKNKNKNEILQQLQKFEKSVIKNMKLPNPTSDLMKSAVLLLGSMNPLLGSILTALIALRGTAPLNMATGGLYALGAGATAIGNKVKNFTGGLLSGEPLSAERMSRKERLIRHLYNSDPKKRDLLLSVSANKNQELKNLQRNTRLSAILNTAAKKVPGLGVVAGVGGAFRNFLKGDTFGGFGELASGLFGGLMPGPGTAISTGIDTWLGAREVPGVRRAKSLVGSHLQRGALRAKNIASNAGKWVANKSGVALDALKQTKAMSAMAKAVGSITNMVKGIGGAIKAVAAIAKTKLLLIIGIAAAVGLLAMWIKNKFFSGDKGGPSTNDLKRYAELHKKKTEGSLTKDEEKEYKALEKSIRSNAKDNFNKNKAAGVDNSHTFAWQAGNAAVNAARNGQVSQYTPSKFVDSSQVLSKKTLESSSPEEVAKLAAARPGAYERVTDRAGYWKVATNLFAKTSDNKAGGSKYGDVLYTENGTLDAVQNLVDQGYLPKNMIITSALKSKKSSHKGHTGRTFDISYTDKKQYAIAKEGLKRAMKDGLISNWVDEVASANHLDFTIAGDNSKGMDIPTTAKVQPNRPAEKAPPVQVANNGLREDLWKRAMGEGNSKLDKTRNLLFSATDITGSLGVWGITRLNTAGGT